MVGAILGRARAAWARQDAPLAGGPAKPSPRLLGSPLVPAQRALRAQAEPPRARSALPASAPFQAGEQHQVPRDSLTPCRNPFPLPQRSPQTAEPEDTSAQSPFQYPRHFCCEMVRLPRVGVRAVSSAWPSARQQPRRTSTPTGHASPGRTRGRAPGTGRSCSRRGRCGVRAPHPPRDATVAPQRHPTIREAGKPGSREAGKRSLATTSLPRSPSHPRRRDAIERDAAREALVSIGLGAA
jgi:hypothetical protein